MAILQIFSSSRSFVFSIPLINASHLKKKFFFWHLSFTFSPFSSTSFCSSLSKQRFNSVLNKKNVSFSCSQLSLNNVFLFADISFFCASLKKSKLCILKRHFSSYTLNLYKKSGHISTQKSSCLPHFFLRTFSTNNFVSYNENIPNKKKKIHTYKNLGEEKKQTEEFSNNSVREKKEIEEEKNFNYCALNLSGFENLYYNNAKNNIFEEYTDEDYNDEKSNFKIKEIESEKSSRPIKVVFAYSTWSSPSAKTMENFNMIIRNLNNLDDLKKNIKFIQINVDMNPILIKKLHIKSLPTLQFLYNNKLMREIIGEVNEKELKGLLDEISSYCFFENKENENGLFGIITKCNEAIQGNDYNTLNKLKKMIKDKPEWRKFSEGFLLFSEIETILKVNSGDISSDLKRLVNKIPAEFFKKLSFSSSNLESSVDEDIEEDLTNAYVGLLDFNQKYSSLYSSAKIVLLDPFPSTPLQLLEAQISTCCENQLLFPLVFSSIQDESREKDTEEKKKQVNMDFQDKVKLYISVAVKYFRQGRYEETLKNALKAYKIDADNGELQRHLYSERTFSASRSLLQNLFLSLGARHELVQKGRAELEVMMSDSKHRMLKWPHPRAFKGGKPRLLRGKSGKWMWLGPEWKPRWAPRKNGKWEGPRDWYLTFNKPF